MEAESEMREAQLREFLAANRLSSHYDVLASEGFDDLHFLRARLPRSLEATRRALRAR